METEVGFITPDNQKFFMKNSEVLEFCKKLYFDKKNIQGFENFQKDYSYFEPYFDFVMFNLNYIFINPLGEKGTFLKAVGSGLYKIDETEEKEFLRYDDIEELTIRKRYSDNPYMTAVSDKSLNIRKVKKSNMCSCMIDSNGYSFISSSASAPKENYEITSLSILNQYILYNSNLLAFYNTNIYSTSFLVERCGFIRMSYDNKNGGNMVGVERFLTPIQYKIMDDFKSLNKCVFCDMEEVLGIYYGDKIECGMNKKGKRR